MLIHIGTSGYVLDTKGIKRSAFYTNVCQPCQKRTPECAMCVTCAHKAHTSEARVLLQQHARAAHLLAAERAQEVGHQAVHQLEVRGQRRCALLHVI